ncbi:MAG: glycosyltransferase, partial [Verrucomicrobia bacterium]|nr:glycosyltransferase [Verrucomicrobiota bacterium]
MAANRSILTATPMRYGESLGFFARDAGLLCLALRELGVNSRFVALGEPRATDEPPLILGRLEQFTDASWWRQWNADAVVLNSWAAPRYEPVARAIKSSGAKLMVRLDSDGCKSPRAGFGHYFGFTYSLARDEHKPLPGLYALTKTLAFRLAPALHDSGMLAHLAHADVIGIESPRAAECFCKFLAQLGRVELAARVRVVPHPVREEFQFNTAVAKQRKIIAVGRWDSHFKNAPLLVQSLALALETERDARAVIIGPGEQEVQRRINTFSQTVRERIRVTGRLSSDALHGELETSQTLLVTSRYESF